MTRRLGLHGNVVARPAPPLSRAHCLATGRIPGGQPPWRAWAWTCTSARAPPPRCAHPDGFVRDGRVASRVSPLGGMTPCAGGARGARCVGAQALVAGRWSKRRGRSCARSPRRPPRCARRPCRSRSDAASAGNSLTHHGPSTSSDSWRRPPFRTHPTAPGPSRPSRAREQKAEHHLEDRSDHRNSCSGKPRNSVWGLDAGRRLHGQNFDWNGWSEGPRRREQPGAGFGATAADAARPRVVAGRQSLETERMNG